MLTQNIKQANSFLICGGQTCSSVKVDKNTNSLSIYNFIKHLLNVHIKPCGDWVFSLQYISYVKVATSLGIILLAIYKTSAN